MSIYQFVESRIRMGRMDPVAVSRVNRAVRVLDTEGRLHMCAPKHQEVLLGKRENRLKAMPIAFRDACALVNMHHRHHSSPVGHLFSGGVFDGGVMCGAVIVGRPVARHQDDGHTVELLRVVSDGTRNACSKAMGWAIRAARDKGYDRVITYTLSAEPGSSLLAVGFQVTGQSDGGSWSSPSRRRSPDRHPTTPKRRWEIRLSGEGNRQGRLL